MTIGLTREQVMAILGSSPIKKRLLFPNMKKPIFQFCD
jgi:hypothetical protein